jgi:hypothetical protein
MKVELWCSWQGCVLVTVTEVLKYVPVPILFIHSGAACKDAAIIVYTSEYRLLMGLHRMSKICTDKLQGVNVCCSTRKIACCSMVLWVTAYRKSKCTKYQDIKLELQWGTPIWMVILLVTGKSPSYKSFHIHYVSLLDVIDFYNMSNNLQVSLGI